MKISSLLKLILTVTTILSVVIMTSLAFLVNGIFNRETAFHKQMEYSYLASELRGASDYLTEQVRGYVQFGEKKYYDNYLQEVNHTKTRDKVVNRLKKLGTPKELLELVEEAKQKSDTLIKLENAAMKAVRSNNMEYARQFVFGEAYDNGKQKILKPLDKFQKNLDQWSAAESEKASQWMKFYLWMTGVSTLLLLLIILSSLILILKKIQPLKAMTQVAHQIAKGDLAVEKMNGSTKDEVGILALSINDMADNLKQLIHEVNMASNQLASSAEQLTASADQSTAAAEGTTEVIQDLASGAENQQMSVEESYGLLADMKELVEKISGNAAKVSASAESTSEKGLNGNRLIGTSIAQMNSIQENVLELSNVIQELGDRSNDIGSIVNVITAISDQTNLLALNAAIEAARAGEQGKGFSVVADEVRKLAEQSSHSANQISSLVSVIQQSTIAAVQKMEKATNEVASGIIIVNEAGASFNEMIHSTKDVSKEIAITMTAMKSMIESTEQVTKSMQIISEEAKMVSSGAHTTAASSQEQLAITEEISSSAIMLAKMAEELQNLIAKFKMA